MATGKIRAAFSPSEPELGSDVQVIKTSARKREDGSYEINGQKMWVTMVLSPRRVRARQDYPTLSRATGVFTRLSPRRSRA